MPWFRQTAARPAAALFHLAPVAVQSYGRHAARLAVAAHRSQTACTSDACEVGQKFSPADTGKDFHQYKNLHVRRIT